MLSIMEILIGDKLPDMIPGSLDGFENSRALDNDREITSNKVTKGEISPSSSFFWETSFNIMSNQHFSWPVSIHRVKDPFGR